MSTGAPKTIVVWVIVPPRVLLLDIAGPLEALRRAGLEQSDLRFDVRYASPAADVTSSIGLTLSAIEPLPETLDDDAMVVLPGSADSIAFAAETPDTTVARDKAAIVGWLARNVRDQLLVSICSGALLAARAGLLDGRDCTTHFSCCAELGELAPNARVFDNRLYVADGNRCSSAGVTAGTDLMLHLIGQWCGPAVALAVARQLVVYLRRSGSDPQLSPWLEGRNHIHPAVHRAQDAIAGNPSRVWSLAALARIANTSPRHLSRLFNEYAGMSVPDYVNRLRVSLARELLGQTRLDMERVAERSGFASARQLRRAWRRSYATAPHEARAAS
ncbi:MAG TPA: helix-turn-helix domain-containing protein [Rhodanobacteraceae bacterium]